jgi:hypothetical protein
LSSPMSFPTRRRPAGRRGAGRMDRPSPRAPRRRAPRKTGPRPMTGRARPRRCRRGTEWWRDDARQQGDARRLGQARRSAGTGARTNEIRTLFLSRLKVAGQAPCSFSRPAPRRHKGVGGARSRAPLGGVGPPVLPREGTGPRSVRMTAPRTRRKISPCPQSSRRPTSLVDLSSTHRLDGRGVGLSSVVLTSLFSGLLSSLSPALSPVPSLYRSSLGRTVDPQVRGHFDPKFQWGQRQDLPSGAGKLCGPLRREEGLRAQEVGSAPGRLFEGQWG